MGILALSAILVAGAGFYLFAKTFPNVNVGNKKLKKDLDAIRAEVDAMGINLVPLTETELENLSTDFTQRSTSRGFTKVEKGVVPTIFEEAGIAFYFRKYSNRFSLLYARTKGHEFHYWITKKGAQVTVDEQPVGHYEPDNAVLIGARSNRMIAKLDNSKSDTTPLIIQGIEVASLSKQQKNSSALSKRVFDYAKNNLSPEEKAVLLVIVIYEIIMPKLEQK